MLVASIAIATGSATTSWLTTVIFVLPRSARRASCSRSRRIGYQALIGTVVAVVAGTFPIGRLGEMVSIGTLFAFLLVCLAVIQLRRSRPRVHRPFRTPAVPWVPLFGIGFSLLLMLGLPLATWLRLIVWLAIGPVIYFGYGHRHSVVAEAPGA